MAPEQALAKSSDIDAQTDLWAVGATMFTLLAGRTVHEGDNGPQLLIAAGTAAARSLAEMAPETPPAVVRVVDCALAFQKASRWPTAAAMREALSAAWKSVAGERPSRTALATFFAVEPAAPPESSGPGVAFAPTRPSTPLDEAAPARAVPAATPPGRPATPAHETQKSPSGSEDVRPTPAIAGRAGASTARPVSSPFSHDDPPRVPKQTGPMIAAIAIAAIVAIVGIGWGVFGHSPSSAAPAVAGPSQAQGDRASAPTTLAPTATLAPKATLAPTSPAASLMALAPSAPLANAPPAPGGGTASPKPRPASSTAATTRPTTSASAPSGSGAHAIPIQW
jgi:serine/threonine-protein kinase